MPYTTTTTALARSAARGATALRGGRFWRPSPFFVFGGLCWLLLTLAYWWVPMAYDYGLHAAVIERLKASPLHPRHPLVDLPGTGVPYVSSPYAIAEGLFARATGLTGWEVMKLAGPFNLAVLLTGLNRFVRTLTPRQWAPVLALLTVPLLYGTHTDWRTEPLAPRSLTIDLGYPSTFAIGLALWVWAWASRLRREEARWAVAGLVAVGLVWLWPDTGPASPHWPWLALLGAPALWLRFRRDARDPLVLLCAAGVLSLGYAALVTPSTYGAALILTTLPLQCALAIALAAPRPWTGQRRALAALTAAGAALGLAGTALDPPPSWPTYTWAARHVPPGDVVLTDGYRPTRSLPGHGAHLVAPARPDAVVDKAAWERRRSAVHAYLSPTATRAERQAIADRYDVRWLLLNRGERLPPEAVLVAWSPRTGEALARVNGGSPRES
ncbi:MULTISPECIES: hypothetical protein [unclassified Streptomyces]|uniref:hypothetical protein n=1 Tax=unclassified Streptomyces TaxID=2593676 RepID=UPI00278C35B0|nr:MULTISPECIES: hypothetical protein [unclassified Streptomyces]